MEFLFTIPILFMPIMFPIIGGYMAKCFGRKFWLWFWLSIPLPFISLIVLLALPDKSRTRNSTFAFEQDEFGIYQ